ncbi:MAG: cupin domain-containing protein [Alphaproteobacteria bacterium]|nr:cupin domain-containing protein [Alphaproteobacteria bacterium]
MLKRLDRLSALIDRFRIEATVVPAVEAGIAPSAETGIAPAAGTGISPAAETAGANLFLLMGPAGRPANDCVAAAWCFVRAQAAGVRPGRLQWPRMSISAAMSRPFALALPEEVRIALCDAPALAAVAEVLLDEAMRPRCGGQAILDRLCEIVVVRIAAPRHRTGRRRQRADRRPAHPATGTAALVAMHEAPGRAWRLEDLAAVSGMSRTAFVTGFAVLSVARPEPICTTGG